MDMNWVLVWALGAATAHGSDWIAYAHSLSRHYMLRISV